MTSLSENPSQPHTLLTASVRVPTEHAEAARREMEALLTSFSSEGPVIIETNTDSAEPANIPEWKPTEPELRSIRADRSTIITPRPHPSVKRA